MRRYRWLVASIMLLAAVAAFVWSSTQPVLYQGVVRLYLATSGDQTDPGRIVRSQAEFISSPEVLDRTLVLDGKRMSRKELEKRLMVEPARDADVMVSATSPRGGGDPATEARAVGDAAIAAARQAGRRLFVVGGAGSLNLPDGRPLAETLPDAYRPEALAMRGVLTSLQASDIDWTFFSPAAMISPGSKTGAYRLGTTTLLSNDKGESRISAEDFADALVNELEQPAHRRSQMTIAY